MKPLDYIVKYWVIIATIVAGISTAAIAGQKIATIEEAVKKQTEQNGQVQEIKMEQKVLTMKTAILVKQMDKQDKAMSRQELAMDAQRELLNRILMKMNDSHN